MSNVDNIGAGVVFDDPGIWTCLFDGIEFRDEHVWSMHMLMEHGENVGVGGVIPVNPVVPPAPTPYYPGPSVTIYPALGPDPSPVPGPEPVTFTPVTPVYTPTPLNPVTPAPVPVTSGNGAAFSVGALLFTVASVFAIGRSIKGRSRGRKRGK